MHSSEAGQALGPLRLHLRFRALFFRCRAATAEVADVAQQIEPASSLDETE
jgi:hypothetical protein